MPVTTIAQSAAAVALLLLAAGVARFTRDGLHPGVLCPGLWGTVNGLYAWIPHNFIPISVTTSLLTVTACVAFVLSSLAVSNASTGRCLAPLDTTIVRPLLFWIALLGLPLFAWRAHELAQTADFTESFMINLRIALTREDDEALSYGVLSYLLPLAFSSTLVELAMSNARLFQGRGWLSLLVSVVYSLLATGRTFIFLLFIGIAFIALVQRRIRPSQFVLGSLAFVALGFVGLGVLVNKIGDNSEHSAAMTAVDAFALYFLGGIAAFDVSNALPMALDWGVNVFRSPLAVLRTIGFEVQVLPLVKDYVWVPEPTNVYTVMQPYLRDFDWLGLLAFFALFGYAHGALHQRAKTGNKRFAVLYGLSMYPLLMQFFQDQYFSLLTTWIQFFALVWPCFRARSRVSEAAT